MSQIWRKSQSTTPGFTEAQQVLRRIIRVLQLGFHEELLAWRGTGGEAHRSRTSEETRRAFFGWLREATHQRITAGCDAGADGVVEGLVLSARSGSSRREGLQKPPPRLEYESTISQVSLVRLPVHEPSVVTVLDAAGRSPPVVALEEAVGFHVT